MKKLFKVTTPDGQILTRSSARNYTHACIMESSENENGYWATFHMSKEGAVKSLNQHNGFEWVKQCFIQECEIVEPKALPKKRVFKVKTPNGFTKTTSSLKEVYTHAVIMSSYTPEHPLMVLDAERHIISNGPWSESLRYQVGFFTNLESAEKYKNRYAGEGYNYKYLEIVEVK